MIEFPIYSAGVFKKTKERLDVFNPYTGGIFAQCGIANEQDLEDALQRALLIKDQMAEMPSYKRFEILNQISIKLEEQKDHYSKILSLESGKPWKYASGEISRAIQTFKIAAEESKRLPGEYLSLDWTPSGENREGIVRYFPVGVVAGISPFNFPMNLAVHKIAPAIAAGCPIILKPSSSTPLSTLELAKIIDGTDLPKGAVSILPMDRRTGNLMVTDERFKLLTFTGSPEVGWKMKKDAGKKKIVLELGGNAGVIISKSTDIDHAVKRSVIGGFAYSGQVCIHAQRFYVEDAVFNEFTEKFIMETEKLKTGDPLEPETEISAMIDEPNAIRVEDWVNEAVSNGARILCGGKRKGGYYEPTILTGTKNSMKVCSLEIFGPVVSVEPFTDFEKAVKEVNNSRYGLQAGVFTDNVPEMNFAFKKLEVGGVILNDVPTFRVDHMPYGGIKDSGLGREGLKYAIAEMLEPRILVKNL